MIVLFLDAASCSCSKLALFHFSCNVCFSGTLWLLMLLTSMCAQALVGRSYALCNFVCCHEISTKKKKSYFCLEFGVRFMKTRLFRTVDLKGHHEPPLETEGLSADERVLC